MRPRLVEPREQSRALALPAAAEPPGPRLGMDAVRALLLEDLLGALGERRDRAVGARGHERRQDAVDEQVGGDEAVQSGSSSSSSASGVPVMVVFGDVGAERLEDGIGRAGVAQLVLGHRRGGDRRLERRRADRPLRVAAPERGLVVGERGDERGHQAWAVASPGGGRGLTP